MAAGNPPEDVGITGGGGGGAGIKGADVGGSTNTGRESGIEAGVPWVIGVPRVSRPYPLTQK